MSKHTPGPWVAVTRTNAYIEIEAPSQPGYSAKKVATVSLTNHEANASLIAAAPDLLEALKRMASIIDKMGDMPDGFIHPSPWQTLKCEEALEQARAAIAKAEEA